MDPRPAQLHSTKNKVTDAACHPESVDMLGPGMAHNLVPNSAVCKMFHISTWLGLDFGWLEKKQQLSQTVAVVAFVSTTGYSRNEYVCTHTTALGLRKTASRWGYFMWQQTKGYAHGRITKRLPYDPHFVTPVNLIQMQQYMSSSQYIFTCSV